MLPYAIQWINRYPADNRLQNKPRYLLDSDLSAPFEPPRPDLQVLLRFHESIINVCPYRKQKTHRLRKSVKIVISDQIQTICLSRIYAASTRLILFIAMGCN